MDKFIDCFQKSLRRVTGAGASAQLVFVDTKGILAGTEWKKVLSAAASEAKMLICLVSPTYFYRSWCGRELQVFLQRYEEWKATAPKEALKKARFIFPVIWEPEPTRRLPDKLEELQFVKSDMPKRYESDGMFVLADRTRHSDQFKAAVDTLAKMVRDGLRTGQALPVATVTNLEDLPNAFEAMQIPYDVHLWMDVPGGRTWQRDVDGNSVADLVEDAAANMPVFVHTFVPQLPLAPQLDVIKRRRQVLLLVADLNQPPSPEVAELNQLSGFAGALLLVDTSATTNAPLKATDSWLAQLPAGCLHEFARRQCTICLPLGSLQSVEVIIERARQPLISADDGEAVEDARLQAQAQQSGIETQIKSTLNASLPRGTT